ncbi:beta-phosphoglucomutase family hydrolase [Stutzerimonas tarimensis]|uniref:Beta-phosphoglucomutase family hydrolase n=1 Tax=Stutzerimonas tarimensis TaxID=1507735 RepID=A0ABV7T7D0_9GAMM
MNTPAVSLSPRDYDAVLFDLDGVLTQTASVHAAAWKRLFDDFLRQRASETGVDFVPFDANADYRRYVDGKLRQDGVASFLHSRGIALPEGNPEDPPQVPSVHGLGRRKDQHFLAQLQQHGIETYPAAIDLVRRLRQQQVRTAVVSSSRNCATVLEAAGIAELFDVRVDGTDLARLNLAGKPAPDGFLQAARELGVEPSRAVVIEDAEAGVAAGRAGGFGWVIGVDLGGQAEALIEAGADAVVTCLDQVQVAAEPPSGWHLVFEDFEPELEGNREALCTLGNGYFATRAAVPWASADAVHYPGTYLAGAYNSLRTEVAGRVVENEELVNLPNWLPLGLRVGDGAWFDTREVELLSYHQALDLRQGLLLRRLRFVDAEGRRSLLTERRLVSMQDMHLGALEITLTAENWSAPVTLRSALDGRVINAGAKLYRKFDKQHLEPVEGEAIGGDRLSLKMRTLQSRLEVAQVARTCLFVDAQMIEPARQLIQAPDYIAQEMTVELQEGQTLAVEKLVALYSSRDQGISECGLAACRAAGRAGRFEQLMAEHVRVWRQTWRNFDFHVQPSGQGFALNVPMLLRLNMFHLLQTVSVHTIGLDVGVPARGWTGEAYQGHIFWDELFIFPFLNHRLPEVTRSLLMYRYRRLDEARIAAAQAGYRGAMFPWQSASDGQERTQAFNLNPRSERWVPDNSYLQRHVGSAIAYNVWQHFQVTHDLEFLQFYGAELLLEIAHFWSSAALYNKERERFELHGVMGPDEFHEGYPGAAEAGLNNNAYTNLMAVWVLSRALEALDLLSGIRRSELMSRVGLTPAEIRRWDEISRKMFVPFHEDGIISQFEGYENLLELDWEAYRARYGNIQRLDLILEAENDSPNRYKLSKQADVLMLFYLFSAEELGELFERLGYPFRHDTIPRCVNYYVSRSSHGSTLSNVVSAWVMARSHRGQAMSFFTEALQSDVADIQQGSTAEGIHLGAMAGSVDLIQRVSTGIEVKDNILHLNPQLPPEVDRLDMRIRYRGHSLELRLTANTLRVQGHDHGAAPIALSVDGRVVRFCAGTQVFALNGHHRN